MDPFGLYAPLANSGHDTRKDLPLCLGLRGGGLICGCQMAHHAIDRKGRVVDQPIQHGVEFLDIDAEARHSGIEIQMHRERPARALGSGVQDRDLSRVAERDREILAVCVVAFVFRVQTLEQENRRFEAGDPELRGFGDRGNGKGVRPGSHQSSRAGPGAMSVRVRLDHRDCAAFAAPGRSTAGQLPELLQVLAERREVNLRPGRSSASSIPHSKDGTVGDGGLRAQW